MAIQTEIWVSPADDGDGLYLLGRALGRDPRGCSLTVEEMADAVSRNR